MVSSTSLCINTYVSFCGIKLQVMPQYHISSLSNYICICQ